MADWAHLPNDLLISILQKLPAINDIVSVRAVCKSWRQVHVQFESHLPPKSPWLMLSVREYSDEDRGRRQIRVFYNPWTQKLMKLQFPETCSSGRKCLSLSFGWQLTLFGFDFRVQLLNPFLRYQITLPPLSELPFEDVIYRPLLPSDPWHPKNRGLPYVRVLKAAVSSDPWKVHPQGQGSMNPDCILMLIFGNYHRLAFTRLGDDTWCNVQIARSFFVDVTYCKGKFYAVEGCGMVTSCDLSDYRNPKYKHFFRPWQFHGQAAVADDAPKYLVESCGDLLLILRIRDGWRSNSTADYTETFEVLKLQEGEDGDRDEWVEVKSLGDRALFLGASSSMSLSASDCNSSNNFKANCIYFTNAWFERFGNPCGARDVGVFDMETRTSDYYEQELLTSLYLPPLWYI